MTLDKAIEILKDLLGDQPTWPPDDERDALKLGIEALTFIRLCREHDWEKVPELLHGETAAAASP